MVRAVSIVPPKPRELRVMRRPKTRRALQTCVGAAALALIAVLLSATGSYAALLILVGGAVVGGVSTVVLRFVEQPREVVVRKVHYEREPPVIH